MSRWQCNNSECKAVYAEYVNGCPKCATGETGGSHSVNLVRDGTETQGIIDIECEDAAMIALQVMGTRVIYELRMVDGNLMPTIRHMKIEPESEPQIIEAKS